MGNRYKGIVIPDEIIIVENGNGQGFVVPPNNEKVLNTALNWAEHTVWPEEGTWEERRAKAVTVEGIQHRYQNGHFKMRLNESAGYSYNGGKLSFWNCDIIAPDGKKFLIGINQELLCTLLSNCTLIKGEVQEDLWLGKQQGNTGLYTVDMDDFKQAQEEIKQKENMKSKTVKYEPGDLIGSLTKDLIYIGEFIKYSDLHGSYQYNTSDKLVSRYDCAHKKYHLYVERFKYYYSDKYGYRLEIKEKKTSYTVKEKGTYKNYTFDKVREVLNEQHDWYEMLKLLEFEDIDINAVCRSLKICEPKYEYVHR